MSLLLFYFLLSARPSAAFSVPQRDARAYCALLLSSARPPLSGPRFLSSYLRFGLLSRAGARPIRISDLRMRSQPAKLSGATVYLSLKEQQRIVSTLDPQYYNIDQNGVRS